MEVDKTIFVILLVTVCTVGWLINNWIRARHGYALEDEWGGKTERGDHAATIELKRENEELKTRLAALEQRTGALETIVTDSAYDVSRQIDALRHEPAKEIAAK